MRKATKQQPTLLTYKSLPLFDPSRRSDSPNSAYGKKYVSDYLQLPSLEGVPVRSGAACNSAIESLTFHKSFARDVLQQAPWMYQPGERFRTLAAREYNAISRVVEKEEQERMARIAAEREAKRQAQMRRAELRERDAMALEEMGMQVIITEEKRLAAIAERTRKRRAPVLKRLQELKELQLSRESEKHRLEQEELKLQREEAERVAAEEAKEAKYQAELQRLREESKYTSDSKVERKTVDRKEATSAVAGVA